jgi:O-antigen/teichoic acid export membrane protein
MNLPRQIFKNTAAMATADLVTKAGQILLSFLVARILQASGLGIYSTAIAYYGLLAVASGMGAQDFLVREIARERDRTNRYVIHASVMGTLAAIVAMVIFWVILPNLNFSVELTSGMYVVILAIIPGTLNTIQHAVFVAHQRVEFVLYTRFVGMVINVGLSLYLLLRGYGIVSLLIAFVVVEYVVMVCLFFFINRYVVSLHWEFDLAFAWKLVWEMRSFTALSILAALFAQPEVIILSLVENEEQIGYYSAALKLAGFWYVISQMYMANVYPVLSRSYHLDEHKFQVIQDKSIKYLLALSLPLTAGMIATAESIVTLAYGPGFEAAFLPLQILALSILSAYVSAVLWRVLAARNRQNSVLWVRIITLITRLGGGFLLIWYWGILGAAISASANLLLNTLLLALYTRRDGIRQRVFHLSWRFALAALVMGSIIWILRNQLDLWALVPLAGLVYLLLVVLLKGFAADDIALFRQVLRPSVEQKP